jgi:HEAT repeat protein
MDPSQPRDLLPLLDSPNPEERLNAIRALGEVGDAEALAVLRARLKALSAEHTALIVAVGKLNRRSEIK